SVFPSNKLTHSSAGTGVFMEEKRSAMINAMAVVHSDFISKYFTKLTVKCTYLQPTWEQWFDDWFKIKNGCIIGQPFNEVRQK
ncbi:MAG: hypothetical protein DI538_17800, partial [Azospira oryzae]